MPDHPRACPQPLLICDACGSCLATCRCALAHPVLRAVAVCGVCTATGAEPVLDAEEDDAPPETEDAYPWCPHATPDQGDLCPICTAIWDEYDAEEDDAHV